MNHLVSNLSNLQRERALSQLKNTLLFESLKNAQLDAIVDSMRLVTLHDGDVLFQQHEPASHIFLLATGQIKLSRFASNGTEKIISLIQPGNTFAEAAIFSSHGVYPVGATALGDCSVWMIEVRQYRYELQQSTDACFAVCRQMSERLHQQLADIERLTLHTASSRLVAFLLSELEDNVIDNHAKVKLRAPKNVIASQLSIVPSTFSRTLAKLSQDELITVHENEIDLLDIAHLKEYVDDILV